MKRFLGTALFIIGLSGLGYWAAQEFLKEGHNFLLSKAPIEKQFMMAWQEDLNSLAKSNSLHEGFKDLKQVQFFSKSEILKKITAQYPLHIKTNEKGQYVLEVFADEILDNGGVVVQYDLVDTKTGNTVWELGRTFAHKLPVLAAEKSVATPATSPNANDSAKAKASPSVKP